MFVQFCEKIMWKEYIIICLSLNQHDVSEEDVLRRKQTKGLTDLVYDVACSANQHLDTVRTQVIDN